MSIEIENDDLDVSLMLSPAAKGVDIEAIIFVDDANSKTVPLGTFPIRDLLIALHALSASTDTATSDSSEKHTSGASPISDKPRYRNFRTPWRRK